MSAAEAYLRELRRALPIGCRRRFVAEMREHFASAADAGEPEELTIERLGPAAALADQLIGDVRSGALGRTARLSAALTTTRLLVLVTLLAIAIAASSAAVVRTRSASSSPPAHERPPSSPVVHNGVTVRRLILTLQGNLGYKRYGSTRPTLTIRLQHVQGMRPRVWLSQPVGVVPDPVLRVTQTRVTR